MLSATSAGAQDHVNVTIVAPAFGAFPRLTAASFDITNQDQLVSVKSSTTQGQTATQTMVGLTQPIQVQMGLPWGGEVAQLIKAMVSGINPAIDHITCDFVHTGSDQPYYTVVIDQPIISRVDLAYDSAAATATEQIAISARQVEFMDGSSTGSSTGNSTAGTSTPRARIGSTTPVLRRATAPPPRLRLVASPAMIRRIATSTNSAAAGPPIAGFASFAAASGSTMHFAPEGSYGAWTNGAMTTVETLSLSVQRSVVVHTVTGSDGSPTLVPVAGTLQPVTVSFTKAVGSLTNDLQSAVSSTQRVTTTFELADAPSRLGYSFVFASGRISGDHTSLSNGHATEQVTITNMGGLTVTDLRRNISAQVP